MADRLISCDDHMENRIEFTQAIVTMQLRPAHSVQFNAGETVTKHSCVRG